ncbi:MAG TPA: metal ABC transporter substrate-binding protein [Actinomycetales bacterium]|nr:metal ABC transporter substrate-binding protein [Actinomycetales bacterium]
MPLVLLGLALAGCGDGAGTASGTEKIDVVASFYPLEYVSERVGGQSVEVTNLTKPGVEAHDLELVPRDVGRLADADLVVYLRGFQPAVDGTVASQTNGSAFDVTSSARLQTHESANGDAHGHDEGDGHDTASQGAVDPHFWLDPTRLADVGDAVAARLEKLDPGHAQEYKANAERLRADLEGLDREFAAGLAKCTSRELVTSHTAFGYLAERYDLHQVGISGLSPETEPTAQNLAAVTRFVKEHKVGTIYYETLVDPAVAQTVADETGARSAVLDPLEGLTNQSAGSNYLEVMRTNLATLRAGQGCS